MLFLSWAEVIYEFVRHDRYNRTPRGQNWVETLKEQVHRAEWLIKIATGLASSSCDVGPAGLLISPAPPVVCSARSKAYFMDYCSDESQAVRDEYLVSHQNCEDYAGFESPSTEVRFQEYPSEEYSGYECPDSDSLTRNLTAQFYHSSVQNGLLSDAGILPPRPLKITCVGPGFCIGGVEQHLRNLAKFLTPEKAQIVGCLVTDSNHLDKTADMCLPFPVRLCQPESLARMTADSDVVLMWGQAFNGHLQQTSSLKVFVAHGESWWTRQRLQESNHAVDHVIAVSSHVRQKVCQGFQTTTILNGVDSARLTQSDSRESVRERLGFDRNDFVIGSVGRFTLEKQFHLLIEATAILPQHFKLLLVGFGRREQELLALANRRIPGRYAFVSASTYLGDYYKSMDAFGLVSDHEGFGMVLAEAMMCERPVFATNVGCVPEIIRHSVNGLIVSPARDSIAKAALLIHNHPHWAEGMAKEASLYAMQHLNAKRMARDYENLFLNLLAAGSRKHA